MENHLLVWIAFKHEDLKVLLGLIRGSDISQYAEEVKRAIIEKDPNSIKNRRVIDLNLSVRARNVIHQLYPAITIGEFDKLTFKEFNSIRNAGIKTWNEIRDEVEAERDVYLVRALNPVQQWAKDIDQ